MSSLPVLTKTQIESLKSLKMPSLPQNLTEEIGKMIENNMFSGPNSFKNITNGLKPQKECYSKEAKRFLMNFHYQGQLSIEEVDLLEPKITNIMYHQRHNGKQY
jgi:hypothetical protein